MILGIDIGTSGVKAIVLSEDGTLEPQASAPLSVSRPQTRGRNKRWRTGGQQRVLRSAHFPLNRAHRCRQSVWHHRCMVPTVLGSGKSGDRILN